MENLNLIIAKNICEYRKKCELTQSELANLLNFSDKSVSKWERGLCCPDISLLPLLASLFSKSIDELFSDVKA